MSADEIEKALAKQSSQVFEVFEDNWQIFEVFWSIKSQWNVIAGFGIIHYQCIHTQSIASACQLLNIVNTRDIFEGVLIMEQAAKKVLNER